MSFRLNLASGCHRFRLFKQLKAFHKISLRRLIRLMHTAPAQVKCHNEIHTSISLYCGTHSAGEISETARASALNSTEMTSMILLHIMIYCIFSGATTTTAKQNDEVKHPVCLVLCVFAHIMLCFK